jgi:3-hydroxymyristoyl/3-hydroxydecanoyl-(acyl carrier protein) dehydratase
MPALVPLDMPATTAGTTGAAPVYRSLMVQPQHWLRQAFFVGRPTLPVARVVEAMQANGQTLAAAAQDWGRPVAALVEALDYYQRFQEVIAADAAEECALRDALTPPDGPCG